MSFTTGPIQDVIWKALRKYHDPRGWLCELFRLDEMPAEFHPVMAYISETQEHTARGPHEHVDQADFFCFLGPGNFKMYLWDNRPSSPTYRNHQTDVVGADKPMSLIVPPGVVHAYRNIGPGPGIVFNAPNRLYKGPGRKAPVDEIRHEEDKNSIFKLA
jgi:dTDP-4-dehydrorhamnose 3,5-epimerase